ncbi:regulatory LuxR family protein [Nocardiopsis sp. Huas11]|uniref:LuxR C-terminal-related transcriptional regulator n=1 Tax=Nocardiopsis sp. Huas11 TaxID=2183912 RepID=UPI000EB302B5|nr:LuxR family transcriptional regulator [Nocardiopsis sp. Huas11]RKS08363.1 regulatory LuxR family protein [Nocardiopsis sp. Huas11]
MTRVPPPTRVAPLYGRDQDIAATRDLLRAARSGRSGILLVRGRPGSGRSALLAHTRAHAPDFTVLAAHAAPEERHLALAGLHQLLRPAMPYLPRLPAAQREALHQSLECGRTDRPFPLAVAALGLITEIAAEHPVLICADDVHLMDAPSREVLAFAGRRLADEGVATLLSAETGARGAPGGVPVLDLAPLDRESTEHLLDAAAAPDPLADTVRAELATLARGNPRAALELLAATGPAQRSGAADLGRPPRSRGDLTDTYLARAHRLPAPVRHRLLLLAADPGAPATSVLSASPEDGDPVPGWERAERAGLVHQDDGWPVLAHPVVGPALYHGLPAAERCAAHRALARRAPADAAWHRAAARTAPDEAAAADLRLLALDRMGRRGHGPASVLFERAADLTPAAASRAMRLAESARAAWLSGNHPRTLRLLERVGDELPALGTHAGSVREHVELVRADMELRSGVAIAAFQRLRTFADRLPRHDSALALRALHQAGEACCLSGDHTRYFATAERALSLHGGGARPQDRLVLDYMAGKAALFQGRHPEGVAALRRVMAAADGTEDPQHLLLGGIAGLLCGDNLRAGALAGRAVDHARRTGADSLVPRALEFLTYAELWLGRLSLAEAGAAEGLRTAEATGQDNCAGHHRAGLALLAAIRGEEDACRERAGAALALADSHDLGLPAGLASWALALLDLALGRVDEAAARLLSLRRAGPGRGHTAVHLLSTPHLVEATMRGSATEPGPDRAEAVRSAVTTFERWAEATGEAAARALALRCRALLASGRESTELYGRAVDLHASGYCDLELARTQLLFGSHLRRERSTGRAREHLTAALETFELLGARPWADQARAELRATRGRPAQRERDPARELSPQQLQIARHVATGSTNREVAALLFLSPRTVDHHLRNIYAKLGIRSRVELARLLG